MAHRRLVVWIHSDRYPTWSIPPATVRRLEDIAGPGWEVESIEIDAVASGDGVADVPARVREAVEDAEIYFGFGIPDAVIRHGAELRWVHSAAAGVRTSLSGPLGDSDVLFTNSAGVYGPPLGEWAIGGMLHFARGFDIVAATDDPWPYDAMAAEGHPLRELAGSHVTVVGYGGIGSEVGRRAHALGMRVTAVRAHPDRPTPEEVERVYGPDEVGEAVAEAHYVVLALAETAGTEGLVDRELLAKLRPDCVLLNLSRGSIVDEPALIEALRAGRLRGAALDVFATEPLPADSPLPELPKVLATPHAGSVSPRFWERQSELMAGNLARYLRGEELVNLVDRQRGY
ncbi:MAG: D-2-hydroxyacid dehydrogenase [Gemmatimonadota bacterium]